MKKRKALRKRSSLELRQFGSETVWQCAPGEVTQFGMALMGFRNTLASLLLDDVLHAYDM